MGSDQQRRHPLGGDARDLAWELAVGGLDRQSQILGDLRARTGTILAAAGVVASVIAAFFSAQLAQTPSRDVDGMRVVLITGFVALGAGFVLRGTWLCGRVLSSLSDTSSGDIEGYVCARTAGKPLAEVTGPELGDERPWRVTLNSANLRRFLSIPGVDEDSVRDEVTEFLNLRRRLNFDLINQRTRYFNRGAGCLGVGVVVWIGATIIYATA